VDDFLHGNFTDQPLGISVVYPLDKFEEEMQLISSRSVYTRAREWGSNLFLFVQGLLLQQQSWLEQLSPEERAAVDADEIADEKRPTPPPPHPELTERYMEGRRVGRANFIDAVRHELGLPNDASENLAPTKLPPLLDPGFLTSFDADIPR
jgi:hypothetical protein